MWLVRVQPPPWREEGDDGTTEHQLSVLHGAWSAPALPLY